MNALLLFIQWIDSRRRETWPYDIQEVKVVMMMMLFMMLMVMLWLYGSSYPQNIFVHFFLLLLLLLFSLIQRFPFQFLHFNVIFIFNGIAGAPFCVRVSRSPMCMLFKQSVCMSSWMEMSNAHCGLIRRSKMSIRCTKITGGVNAFSIYRGDQRLHRKWMIQKRGHNEPNTVLWRNRNCNE